LPDRIDPSDPKFGCRWISYFDSKADLSDLDASSLLQLRERLRPVVAALAARGEFQMILVSNSVYLDPLLTIWRVMVGADPDYASNPVVEASLKAAGRQLGLSETDAEQARAWIEAQVAEFYRTALA
jgi:hypothetical protein